MLATIVEVRDVTLHISHLPRSCHLVYPSYITYMPVEPIFFHRLIPDLGDYMADAWSNPGKHNEVIDGEPTVLIDHDMAMVWTPFWFRVHGELSHVGTNCFHLLKDYERVGENGGEGKWEWKVVTACDTGRKPTEEDKRRLDEEYERSGGIKGKS